VSFFWFYLILPDAATLTPFRVLLARAAGTVRPTWMDATTCARFWFFWGHVIYANHNSPGGHYCRFINTLCQHYWAAPREVDHDWMNLRCSHGNANDGAGTGQVPASFYSKC
jgi:hypothetical protein